MSKITAVKTLGKIAKYASVITLLDLLDDEEIEVRIAVIEALSDLASRFPETILLPLFARVYDEEEDPTVRATAVWALGKAGNIVDIRWLTDALDDQDWRVREQAAIALGKQGERTPTEVLEEHIDEEAAIVCQTVVKVLGELSEEAQTHQQEETLPPKEFLASLAVSSSGLDDIDEQNVTKVQHFVAGSVEFDGLEPGYFANDTSIPIVVQALDNQWATLALSRAMFKGKITYQQAKKYLEGLVRTEYIRALINGQQVIINRAFLYNNPVLSRDYMQKGQSRLIFEKFLEEGTIVPFLLYEHSPNQEPAFGTDMPAFNKWQQVCEEVRMKCVRFSWDEEAHKDYLEQFTGRFHTFTQSYQGKNIRKLARDLSLGENEENLLRSRLTQLHRFSMDYYDQQIEKQATSHHITRNVLYKNFITEGENPAERLYDPNKPLAGEMKQLLDLAYNGYLADALNGYLLTPIDSPTRLILQDWQTLMMEKTVMTGDTLIKILRSNAFAKLQEGLYLKSMGSLTLQDVLNIRHTEEWDTYIKSLQRLLKTPILFADLAPDVYQNYVELAKTMTAMIAQRNEQRSGALVARWEPSVRLLTTIGGASLSTVWNEEGVFHYEKGEETLRRTTFSNGDAPLTMRLIIGDSSSNGPSNQARLLTSIELIKGKIPDAINEWKLMMKQLGKTPTFDEFTTGHKEVTAPTLNEPER